MDWLKKLPVVGPPITRLTATHAWRSYERLDRVKWARLAAAMTFISFVALFPLITVAATIAAATLDEDRQHTLENKITEQVPGISDQLDIGALVDNAGTVGLIAGALLLFTGIGWVGSMRECLRAVWELPDEDENPFLGKLKDAGVLVGLGGAVLVTITASTLASTTVGWTTRQLGIDEGGWGGVLLRTAAFAVAVLADFLLLLYLLTLLPGVQPERRRLVVAALIGAAGFELLKLLLSGYMQGVASKNMYGAFGVPVALLLWINFTSRLLLFCAAWTATRHEETADRTAEEEEEEAAERAAEGTTGRPAEDVVEGPAEEIVVGPAERTADGPADLSGGGASTPAAANGG